MRPAQRQREAVAADVDVVEVFLLAELLDQLEERLFAVELRFGCAAGQQRIDGVGAGVDAEQQVFV